MAELHETKMGGATSEQNAAASKSPPTPKPQNPALKMLGIPNFRFRLPSRNWLIFLTVTGSFAGTWLYDRREKKRAQQKWCNLVAHIASEPLPTNQTRRKLTIFLAAPPGDGLRSARDHFREYVKPVLVSGALDYEIVEGRQEGDIRAALADRIRKARRRGGEGEPLSEEEEDAKDRGLTQVREQLGIYEEPGVKGDVVIGRHTWKEYIRGLHEGWLGPLTEPTTSSTATTEEALGPRHETDQSSVAAAKVEADAPPESDTNLPGAKPEGSSSTTSSTEMKKEEMPKSTGPAPPFILPSSYTSQPLAPIIPAVFESSSPIHFPHILGFLNTPIRIYRFLTRRYLADSIGRDVAAIVLASSSRQYYRSQDNTDAEHGIFVITENAASPTATPEGSVPRYEQQSVLEAEEKEWPKSVRRKLAPSAMSEGKPEAMEREWLGDVVVDPRIAARMRAFELLPEEELRAGRIATGQELVAGEE